ncbi:hypothetical protein Trydic_g7431 [Trypoxylus dichotomus]
MTKTLLQWILLVYLSGLAASEGQTRELRVVHKLVGGHISLTRDDDVELITSGAGEGKGSKKKSSDKEEKKTLAQQVAEGKYALIQTELFSKPLKKPGLLSYRENSEVPRDTITNLGGLNKSDIWLSENHLLVIKGGSFPPHSSQNLETNIWPSIDDYNAPDRQVKIPAHPKVPPPFPVQLTDNGPLLLLGTNASKTINGTYPSPVYPLFPEENYVPGGEPPPDYPYRYPTNSSSGQTPIPIPQFPGPGLDYYDPAKERPLNGSLPFFPFVGPGDLLPLDNVTYDEDDPSIYYPPPYSFYYKQDNSTEVPPGPLVPGIVLPPPPNFFAPLEENRTDVENKNKMRESTSSTYKPTTTHRPTTPITTTASTEKPSTTKAILTHNFTIPTLTPLYRKPPTVANIQKKYPTITILKAITTTLPHAAKQDGRSYKIQQPPQTKTVVTTTRVPLKSYYTSKHIEPVPISKPNDQYLGEMLVNTHKTTSRPPTQYYFYGENIINTTPRLQKPPPKYEIPDYYIPAKEVDIVIQEQPPRGQNVQYYYVNNNARPQYSHKPDTFSVHIARLKDQIHTYQSALRDNDNYYLKPAYKPISKPIYQYSFQSINYPTQRNHYLPPSPDYSSPKDSVRHYDVEIEEAVEVTPPPSIYENTQEHTFYYPETATENPKKNKEQIRAKPISEFSFEVTPNPIFQQFYTKHDEPYIDDVTKEYFTVFGKKIPIATTPIPANLEAKYFQSRPENSAGSVSLERDTFINYLQPNPQINHHAEYIHDIKYNRGAVPNYKHPRYQAQDEKTEERPYISYKLPGDEGTHFYFITPKLAQKREQNSSFFYSSSS